MIPRLRPSIGWREVAAAITASKNVSDFEQAFAALMGQKHAIAFPYGRTAQLFLLQALGLRDREIILPAYTCVVVAHAVVLSGNRPVFIDSERDGFNMDLEKAEAAITPKTGAIIATSIHGYPVDLDRLDHIRTRHPQIFIIQDCAHSFAADWQGRPVQQAGTAAIFGLNISKLMTSIFGGMITTDDTELATRLKAARDARLTPPSKAKRLLRVLYIYTAKIALSPLFFGWVKRISEWGLLDRFIRYYDEEKIDLPADAMISMDRSEASVGVHQCSIYPTIIAKRRAIAAFYSEALANSIPHGRPPLCDGATYSHYVLRVDNPEQWVKTALQYGLELGRLIDYCTPDMAAYRDITRDQGPFPETVRLNQSVLNVPIWVDRPQAEVIVLILRQVAADIAAQARVDSP